MKITAVTQKMLASISNCSVKRSIMSIVYGGIAVIMVISVVALYSLYTVKGDTIEISESYMPEMVLSNNLHEEIQRVGYQKLQYRISANEDDFNKLEVSLGHVDEYITELESLAQVHHLKEVLDNVAGLESISGEFHDEMKNFHADIKKYHQLEYQMEDMATSLSHFIENVMQEDVQDSEFYVKLLEREAEQNNQLWKALAKEDLGGIKHIKHEYEQFLEDVEYEKKNNGSLEGHAIERLSETTSLITGLVHYFDSLIIAEEKIKIDSVHIQATYEHALTLAESITDSSEVRTAGFSLHSAKTVNEAFWVLCCVIALSVMGAFVFGLTMAANIGKRLARTIDRVLQSSVELKTSSDALSSSSQHLAESSTEQAAGIEEITSSIEEMASQIKSSSESNSQAEIAMYQNTELVEEGVVAINELKTSMDEIEESARETSRIVQTINEIAFQTNLLALNAAVEAARAGDAGKGFSVVAEEVRALAQRSAAAVHDTTQLIGRSQVSSERGVKSAVEVSDKLDQIASASKKMAIMFGEISNTTKEQLLGIDQMTEVMGEMDHAVQENAASSEYSASSAEELSAQAEEMNYIVADLCQLVDEKTLQAQQGKQKNVLAVETNHHKKAGNSSRYSISAMNEDMIPELVDF